MAGRTPHRDEDAALRSMLVIVERAVELQDRADSALFACATGDDPPTGAAREGGVVAGEYHRLWEFARDAAPGAGPESLEGRVTALLFAHCQVVHTAVRFAFPQYRTERSERQRRSVQRLGAIAEQLRSAADELRLWIAVSVDPDDG